MPTTTVQPSSGEPAPSTIERRALIQFHRAVANAHQAYADVLVGLAEPSEAAPPPAIRGSLQRRIVGLASMTTDRGMTSREVAETTTGDEPNSHTALKGLVDKGIVEIVEGSSPQRFRLTVKHRRDRVLRLSRLIDEGEWTTYGDFSIAVYDSPRMALTVARIAAHHPAFSNPHRLLRAGGSVSPEWRDEDGDQGPEECKRRLANEGVWDEAADRAKEDRFVGWEELRRRLASHDQFDEVDAAA
jgi:alkylated DNA nucleotide flippase Atl1